MMVILMATLGLLLGSFAGAQVWRLRARQLREDKAEGDEVDATEFRRLKPLLGKTSQDRSRCLSCGHQLAWYDLIPLASWVSTGGKCRYCKELIGYFEPLMELGFALFFVVSYLTFLPTFDSPLGIARLVVWLTAGVLMGILLAYDAKWFLLPEKLNLALAGTGIVFAIISYSLLDLDPSDLWSIFGAVGIMSGIYLVIFVVSSGRWIGFGDVLLGIGLGLVLMRWDYALLALFLANLLGLLAVLPGMIMRKVTGKTHIPFGPFLIIATCIVVLWGGVILRGIGAGLEQVLTPLVYALMV